MALKLAGGNRDRERRILQWVVDTRFPGALKIFARFKLALNSQVAKHYAQAEEAYRSILEDGEHDLDAGLESTVRQHLADTLEALGRADEATAERDGPGSPSATPRRLSLASRPSGKLLDREKRYNEAIAVYERALSMAPHNNRQIRAELMMHIVLSSSNAGRPADVVRWAEAVIDLDVGGPVTDVARRMAAVGCNNLGRLDDAERHVRIASSWLPRWKNAWNPSRCWPTTRCVGVTSTGPNAWPARLTPCFRTRKRMPWLVIGLVERERGRLEQAIKALEHVNTIPSGHIPALNRRSAATVDRDLAVLHAELGHGDAALALIRQVEPELTGSPKQSVAFDASVALIHALRQERDLALARIASAEAGLKQVPDDGTAQRATLYLLGRAALRLDEPERAEAFLHAYLKLNPNPLYLPYVHYHLAECRRRLGDVVGGRSFDKKAAAAGFGNQWEHLARDRLAAEGASE